MKEMIDIPIGESGDWKIRKFVVTPEDEKLERLRAAISFSSRGRWVPQGIYTELRYRGQIVMSNTPDEMQDFEYFVYMAKGNVLINGLGLGLVADACLQKKEVTHATIIEISPDVINLVGPSLKEEHGNRITIINCDAFDYKLPKGVRYGAVWHDIWMNVCSDNLPEMHKLHRKYGRFADWQGSWCRELCELGRNY